jgi:hypothetical protein
MADALAAISGFIHEVRSSVEDVQAIAAILNGDRSCTIEVDNNTKLQLKVGQPNNSHGKLAGPLPQDHMVAESSMVFGAEKDAWAIGTGAEGTLPFTNDSFAAQPITFTIHWDNPFGGSNSGDASIIGSGSIPLFEVTTYVGAGNTQAPFRFTISHTRNKFKIVNRATNLALDVRNASHNPQEVIQQYPYNNGLNQQWRFAPIDGRYYHIFNEESGLVMDVAGSRADGALQQFPLNDPNHRDNQSWQLIPKGGVWLSLFGLSGLGYFTIKNKATNKVLDVPNGDPHQTRVQQYDENNGDNQQWYIRSPIL